MNANQRCAGIRAVLAAWALVFIAATAGAETAGSLTILHPWARATAPSAQTAVIYLGVMNNGADSDRLVAVSSDLADMAQFHESKTGAGSVMTMNAMHDGIAIPAGQTVMLKPGGMHVMLMGLKQPLKLGDAVPLTLTFEKAGKVMATAKVAGPGAAAPPQE